MVPTARNVVVPQSVQYMQAWSIDSANLLGFGHVYSFCLSDTVNI